MVYHSWKMCLNVQWIVLLEFGQVMGNNYVVLEWLTILRETKEEWFTYAQKHGEIEITFFFYLSISGTHMLNNIKDKIFHSFPI